MCSAVLSEGVPLIAEKHGGADDNSVVVTGQPENPLATGVYLVRYNVSDAAGNPAEEKTRFVVVQDSTARRRPRGTAGRRPAAKR